MLLCICCVALPMLRVAQACLCNAFAIMCNPHNGGIVLCMISITAGLILTDNE